MRVYFLIPLYNEEDNLRVLHQNLVSCLPEQAKTFVFVDDCSSDSSIELIHQLFGAESYHVIEKEQNQGPGHSFNIGFEWILENSSNPDDKIITLEADNTSDIELAPQMHALNEMGYSLVLASVYAQSGGFKATSWFRKTLSFFANMFFRAVFDIKVLTLSSFYRCYSIQLVRDIRQRYGTIINENGFICKLEVLLKAINCEAHVIEIPMILRSDNRVGKSKMKIFKTSISYLKFMARFKMGRQKMNAQQNQVQKSEVVKKQSELVD